MFLKLFFFSSFISASTAFAVGLIDETRQSAYEQENEQDTPSLFLWHHR